MKIRLNSWEKNIFHVIGKTVDGEAWPILTMPEAWQLFSEQLDFINGDIGIRNTQSFLLMSNHYHWICDLGDTADFGVLEWFHESINVGFLHSTQRYLGSVVPVMPTVYRIEHVKQYQTTYRYIYRNPVEAGLVRKAEDYPYSTLPYVLGLKTPEFECTDQMNLIYAPAQILKWLNENDPIT